MGVIRGVRATVQAVGSAAGHAIRNTIDLRDVHVYGGLGLATWGGWQVSPPWTLVIVGAVLAAIGLLARAR